MWRNLESGNLGKSGNKEIYLCCWCGCGSHKSECININIWLQCGKYDWNFGKYGWKFGKSQWKFEKIWLAIKRFMLLRLRPPTNLIAHRKASQVYQPLNLYTLHHKYQQKLTTNINTYSHIEISIQIHHKYQYNTLIFQPWYIAINILVLYFNCFACELKE